MKKALAVLLMAGCGPSFHDAKYDVSGDLRTFTCNGFPDSIDTVWDFDEDGDSWTITNTVTDFTADCDDEDEDGGLTCGASTAATIDGCIIAASYGIDISPTSDGFEGYLAEILTALCDGSSCQADYRIEGDLKD
jgi:hypothetical protein